MLEKEYRWYLIGCDRFGYEPVSEAEFTVKWTELETHAEALKAAEASQDFSALDPAKRASMRGRIQDDEFVKAVLVGMSEDQQQEQ